MKSTVGNIRPKLHTVTVEQFVDVDRKIMVRSKFKYFRNFESEDTINNLSIFILETDQEKDLEYYFKKYDTRNLHSLTISTIKETNIFRILSKCFYRGTNVQNLTFDINQCLKFNDFFVFLSKMTYVENIDMINLCFLNNKIFKNTTFPIDKTIKKITIRECQCTRFANRTVLCNIINNNKHLSKLNINSYAINFEVGFIKFIKKKQIFHSCKYFGQCQKKVITINFDYAEDIYTV